MNKKFYIKSKSGRFVEIDPNKNLEIIYTKEDGEYIPDRERICWLDYYAKGDYYLSVYPGGRFLTTKVYPSKKQLHAAFNNIKDTLAKEIVAASKLHLDKNRKYSKKARAAYDKFMEIAGKMNHSLWFDGAQTIVDKIEQLIMGVGENDND